MRTLLLGAVAGLFLIQGASAQQLTGLITGDSTVVTVPESVGIGECSYPFECSGTGGADLAVTNGATLNVEGKILLGASPFFQTDIVSLVNNGNVNAAEIDIFNYGSQLNVLSSSRLNVTDTLRIGALNGPGATTVNSFSLLQSNQTFVGLNGGTGLLQMSDSSFSGNSLFVGAGAGGTGTLTYSSDTTFQQFMNVDEVQIGSSGGVGTATFSKTAGPATVVFDQLHVGFGFNGDGVKGDGVLNLPSFDIATNEFTVGVGGIGIANVESQIGGVDTVWIGDNIGTGMLNLERGQITGDVPVGYGGLSIASEIAGFRDFNVGSSGGNGTVNMSINSFVDAGDQATVGSSGGIGALNIDDSRFDASELRVGFASGTGTFSVVDGEVNADHFNVGDAQGDGFAAFTKSTLNTDLVSVGNNGSVGSLVIDETTVRSNGGDNVGFGVASVNGGNGTVAIRNGSDVFLETGNFASLNVGNGSSDGVPGNGSLTVEGSDVTLRGGDIFGSIGRNGAQGTLTVTDNGSLLFDGRNFVGDGSPASTALMVGRGNGGVGTLNITDLGSFEIDRDPQGEGYSGNAFGSNISIGREVGATGTLNMNAGTLQQTDSLGTFLFVGREGGTGAANISNSSQIDLHDTGLAGGDGTSIILGRDTSGNVLGSTGEMTITDSTVSVKSDNNFAAVRLGREDGTSGTLTVSGETSVVTVESGGTNAALLVADQSGSEGSLTITDGATVRVNGATTATFEMGRAGDTVSTAVVSNGGQLILNGDTQGTSSGVRVAAAFGDFGRPDNGTANLTISGAGSLVRTNGNIVIGAPELFGGGISSAFVTVENGGTLMSDHDIYIGTGGTLGGNGGNIVGNLILDGGTIAPGASPGSLFVDGNFEFNSGVLELEFAGTGPGQFDFLDITGDFIVDPGTTIVMSFLNGFAPTADDNFDFLQVGGEFKDSSGNIFAGLELLSTLNLVVEGLVGAEFGFVDNGSGGFGVDTVVAGISTATPVPVPAALPLLLLGLGGMGLLKLRRRTV